MTKHNDEPLGDLDPWDVEALSTPPPKRKRKPPISYRFSDEVVDFFRTDGPGWQSRMHTVLINYVRSVKRERARK